MERAREGAAPICYTHLAIFGRHPRYDSELTDTSFDRLS